MNPVMSFTRRALRGVGLDMVRHPHRGVGALHTFLTHFAIDTVLDVGANEGQYAAALRQDGFRGRIVSFEPNPAAYEVLARAAAGDRQREAVNVGLGAEEGVATLNVSEYSVFSSMLRANEYIERVDSRARATRSVEVPVTTVDSVWEQYVAPGARVLLKIDTQGYERAILDGAARSLDRVQGVQLELTLRPAYDAQPKIEEMIPLLRERGFGLYAFIHGFVDPESDEVVEVDGIFHRTGAAESRSSG